MIIRSYNEQRWNQSSIIMWTLKVGKGGLRDLKAKVERVCCRRVCRWGKKDGFKKDCKNECWVVGVYRSKKKPLSGNIVL